MNLNGDEKRIRQLFGEMSLEDQRQMPRFAGVLAAANSRGAHTRKAVRPLRFAMAAAILCAVLLISIAITVRLSKPQSAAGNDDLAAAPATPPETRPGIVPAQPNREGINVEPHKVLVKQVRHRRPSNQMEIAMKSLFAWQSPTAVLLKTPSDDLLKSLPKLGESLQTIRSYSPDEFN